MSVTLSPSKQLKTTFSSNRSAQPRLIIMEKQLLLWITNNNIVHRCILTRPDRHTHEAMQVEGTLMLPGVDHDALFEIAYEASQGEPDNVAVGSTLEEALSNLAEKCGLEMPPKEAMCSYCNGTGSPHPDYGYSCYSCRGSGVIK